MLFQPRLTFLFTVITTSAVVLVVHASDIHPMSLERSPSINYLNNNNEQINGNHLHNSNNNLNQEDIKTKNDLANNVFGSQSSAVTNDVEKRRENQKIIKSRVKKTTLSIIGLLLASQLYANWHKFPSKDEIQNHAFHVATNIKNKGHIGIIYYILGLACCETFGVTTLPVEISGGFVYGIRNGFFVNAVGKIGGAMIAYTIGRTFLSSRIRSKFLSNKDEDEENEKNGPKNANKSNQIINLVQTCVIEEPFTTALVLRYSFFPQLLKNLILSILEPIHWKLFLLVTCLQVLPFTLLFTSLGYDSAQRLLNPDLKMNYIVNTCFFLSTLYGLFGSSSVVAIWYQKKKSKIN